MSRVMMGATAGEAGGRALLYLAAGLELMERRRKRPVVVGGGEGGVETPRTGAGGPSQASSDAATKKSLLQIAARRRERIFVTVGCGTRGFKYWGRALGRGERFQRSNRRDRTVSGQGIRKAVRPIVVGPTNWG